MTSSYADVAKCESNSDVAQDVPLEGKYDPARWELEVLEAVECEWFREWGLSAEQPGLFDNEHNFRQLVSSVAVQLLSSLAADEPTPGPEKFADAMADFIWAKFLRIQEEKQRRQHPCRATDNCATSRDTRGT